MKEITHWLNQFKKDCFAKRTGFWGIGIFFLLGIIAGCSLFFPVLKIITLLCIELLISVLMACYLYHHGNFRENAVILVCPLYWVLFEVANGSQLLDFVFISHLTAHIFMTSWVLCCLNLLVSSLPKVGRLLSAFLQFIVLVPLFLTLYVVVSGTTFYQDTVIALFQTTFSEAKSFLCAFPSAIVILVLWFVSLVVIFLYGTKRYMFKKADKYYIGFVLLFLVFPLKLTISDIRGGYYGVPRLARMYFDYEKATQKFASMCSKMKLDVEADLITKGNNARVAILIGESASRKYVSAKACPFYWAIKEGKYPISTIFCFDRAYTCYPFTIVSLSMALTNHNQYEEKKYTSDSVFDGAITLPVLLKACGYHTRWISNQEMAGSFATFLAVTGRQCDEVIDLTKSYSSSNDYERRGFDEACFSYLKEKVADRCVTFIHLRGSHWLYRVPDQFKTPASFSTYDATLNYTDYCLEKILAILREQKYDLMIYVSDHGEIPYKGHSTTAWMCKDLAWLPMIVYMSADYAKRHPELSNALKCAANKPFTNDLLWNLICGLLEIEGKDMPLKLNPLSKNYMLHSEKEAKTNYGNVTIEDCMLIEGDKIKAKRLLH